jgi:hypothetical protein
MGKYFINYNTGAGNEEVNGTLDQAIDTAIKGISYTGENVDIYNVNDFENAVAQLTWYGTEPTNDDEPIATIGNSGFYKLTTF